MALYTLIFNNMSSLQKAFKYKDTKKGIYLPS